MRYRAIVPKVRAFAHCLRGSLKPLRPSYELLQPRQLRWGAEVRLTPAQPAASRPRAQLRELVVLEIIRPTPNTMTIWLDNRVPEPIRFQAGQYLTLILPVGGGLQRRAYSFCSDPQELARVALTVKRIAGGRVSGWLHAQLRPGDRLQTLGPSGTFGARALASDERVVLIGGGVGVTPLMALAHSLVRGEPRREVFFIQVCRRQEDILFSRQLQELARRSASFGRATVLTRPAPKWSGYRGRLDAELLARLAPLAPDTHYLVCGPQPMMDSVARLLAQAGVPPAQVAFERFIAQGLPVSAEAAGVMHRVTFAHSRRELQVPAEQTILSAALAAGLELEHSCMLGGCGACKLTLLAGEIEMEEPNCLTDEEQARGERLVCVGRPRSAVVLAR